MHGETMKKELKLFINYGHYTGLRSQCYSVVYLYERVLIRSGYGLISTPSYMVYLNTLSAAQAIMSRDSTT